MPSLQTARRRVPFVVYYKLILESHGKCRDKLFAIALHGESNEKIRKDHVIWSVSPKETEKEKEKEKEKGKSLMSGHVWRSTNRGDLLRRR